MFVLFVCFCCFTSQVNSYGHCGTVSSPNHTFSWASLNKQLTSNRAHTFACNWQQPFMNDSAEGRRMTVEIISWSISTKVWDRAGIELATPGSAVSFASEPDTLPTALRGLVHKHVYDMVADDYGILWIIASDQLKFTWNTRMVNWCESSHCIFTAQLFH